MGRVWFYFCVAVGVAFNVALIYGVYCILSYFLGNINESLFWFGAYVGLVCLHVHDYLSKTYEVK